MFCSVLQQAQRNSIWIILQWCELFLSLNITWLGKQIKKSMVMLSLFFYASFCKSQKSHILGQMDNPFKLAVSQPGAYSGSTSEWAGNFPCVTTFFSTLPGTCTKWISEKPEAPVKTFVDNLITDFLTSTEFFGRWRWFFKINSSIC